MKINRNKLMLIFLLILISLFCKFFQYNYLDDSYFTDSNYILYLMNNNFASEPVGTAYYNTALIFNSINIFNISTLEGWSYLITVIFTIIISYCILKDKNKMTFYTAIFLCLSYALLNIYIFNLSKDIIQLIICLLIFYIFRSEMTTLKKLIFSTLILIIESLFFRPYFILILFGFLLSYLYYQNYSKLLKKHSLKYVLLIVLLFLLGIYFSQFVSPSGYNKIMNVRDEISSILEANTEIVNLIEGNSFISFILNYFINGFRILFPLELLPKGIFYVPFVVYQIILSYIIFYSIKNINKNNALYVCFIIGYFLGSILFEPDFGSLVRHESTLFLFYIELFYSRSSAKIERIVYEG